MSRYLWIANNALACKQQAAAACFKRNDERATAAFWAAVRRITAPSLLHFST
jgi:hypothetical protein